MKFFIPKSNSPEHAEEIYSGIRKWAETNGFTLSNKRIYRIKYGHNAKKYEDVVGIMQARINEPVIAILDDFKKQLYCVCTTNRGVFRGEPMMVGYHEVTDVELFDDLNSEE